MFVMTIDQQGSRTGNDAVPTLLEALSSVATVRDFTRTIGDEVQGVLDDAQQVAEAVRHLAVLTGWHIGIGIGPVDEPLPQATAEGRGEAFYAARRAVEAAKRSPAHLVVAAGEAPEAGDGSGTGEAPEAGDGSGTGEAPEAGDGSGVEPDGRVASVHTHCGFAEAALRLLVTALADLRTQSRGYVDFRLDHPDATQAEIAAHFDVSQQAVSRVLSQGSAEIVAGARSLSGFHLERADGGSASTRVSAVGHDG